MGCDIDIGSGAIMKKRMKIDLTLHTILQLLSISLFEKSPFIKC